MGVIYLMDLGKLGDWLGGFCKFKTGGLYRGVDIYEIVTVSDETL